MTALRTVAPWRQGLDVGSQRGEHPGQRPAGEAVRTDCAICGSVLREDCSWLSPNTEGVPCFQAGLLPLFLGRDSNLALLGPICLHFWHPESPVLPHLIVSSS